MATTVVSRDVEEAFEAGLRRARSFGLPVNVDAEDELRELILAGYRLMQESRILDLPSDAPERVGKERLANKNLLRLIDEWGRIERDRQATALTIGGFHRAHASVCPIYPFK